MTNGGYAVITTMKNEGAFLVEWVAHHKALGFDHLVICTNDCEDTTSEMVRRMERMGLAQHHPTRYKPGQSIQRRALRQAMRFEAVQKADWLYVCDADEFLASRAGDGSARALVAAASPDVEAISVPWRRFGTSGQQEFREGPITAQFLRANWATGPQAQPYAFPKTLFRGDIVQHLSRLGVHTPVVSPDLGRDIRRELPGGVAVDMGRSKLHVQADYSVAQVNHYQLRALDSFLVKSARGKVNHVNDKMEFDYWAHNDCNDEPCDLIRRYDAATAGWMADLLADRRLNTLHQRAVRWHQSKIAELHADPHFAEMKQKIEAHRNRMELGETAIAADGAGYDGDADVPDDEAA
ncbi:glycosyltransferase family 2 protein [Gemmobacter fulvus]|uniref:glycosyltransferase family 2 protein n=1 Tax=Gemmobacter fulvus TaxID=2840474 RepID=UPI0027969163|nr:glycosyltransferase family 2 protein [Gemmobacter fulvus]MDQ1848065.1 glycosyltransferase family 2 protein [Gemmobacter fulvus]